MCQSHGVCRKNFIYPYKWPKIIGWASCCLGPTLWFNGLNNIWKATWRPFLQTQVFVGLISPLELGGFTSRTWRLMSTLTKELGDNPGRSQVAHLGHCFCDGCGMEIGGSYLGSSPSPTTPHNTRWAPNTSYIWVYNMFITPITRVK